MGRPKSRRLCKSAGDGGQRRGGAVFLGRSRRGASDNSQNVNIKFTADGSVRVIGVVIVAVNLSQM